MKKSTNRLELPKDFAQQILDNQIEFKLSDNPSNQTLCNLITLYSLGVEYYESIKSYKYLYFKQKMSEIFTTPNKTFGQPTSSNESTKNDSPLQKKIKSNVEEERMEAMEIKEKQKKLQEEVIEKTNVVITNKQAKKILNSINEKQKSIDLKIKNQLQNQNKQLEQKLLLRKRKSFSKSFSAFGLTEITETKDSLFQDLSPNREQNEKGKIQPLIVSFENVINEHQSDSDNEKQIIVRNKFTANNRNKIYSMGNLHDQ